MVCWPGTGQVDCAKGEVGLVAVAVGRPEPSGAGKRGLADLKPYLASVQVQVVAVTPDSKAEGKSLRELDVRRVTGALVLAVVRRGAVSGNPEPDMKLVAGDSLVLVGDAEQVGAASEALS